MNGVDYNEVIISGNINVIKDINELIVTVWWFYHDMTKMSIREWWKCPSRGDDFVTHNIII